MPTADKWGFDSQEIVWHSGEDCDLGKAYSTVVQSDTGHALESPFRNFGPSTGLSMLCYIIGDLPNEILSTDSESYGTYVPSKSNGVVYQAKGPFRGFGLGVSVS